MKRSGMIRKIDNLGRIVVPMEIRKLLDISLQEEMEIFVGEDNDVVIRKVNQNFNINSYAKRIGEMIFKEVNASTYVVSKDKILAVFGEDNSINNDELTSEVIKYIHKAHYTSFNGGNAVKISTNSPDYFAEIIMPIKKDNRPVGAVILASKTYNFEVSHLKYIRLAVGVLEMTINEK